MPKPRRKPPASNLRESVREEMERWTALNPDLGRMQWHQALSHLVAQGTEFQQFAPSNTNPVTNAWRKKKRPKAKQCFYNALMFCLEHPEAEYWEGKAHASPPLSVDHAWVVLGGKVFDFTWERIERPEVCYYLGCHVPTAFAAKLCAERRGAGSVLFDHIRAERGSSAANPKERR